MTHRVWPRRIAALAAMGLLGLLAISIATPCATQRLVVVNSRPEPVEVALLLGDRELARTQASRSWAVSGSVDIDFRQPLRQERLLLVVTSADGTEEKSRVVYIPAGPVLGEGIVVAILDTRIDSFWLPRRTSTVIELIQAVAYEVGLYPLGCADKRWFT